MNRLVFWLLLCLTAFSHTALASILAIDYGAEWIKAVLLAPGQPFDVLLDKSSKRKVQASVGWKRDDRLFGGDAFNIAGRFPTDSFSHLKYLQGAPFDSQTTAFFNTISTAELVSTSRNTVAVKQSDGTEWTVEELIAMELAYIRELAEAASGERVTNAVVTVPPYYTQHERAALISAIEIAGMRAEGLLNDGTAVAINYAMTRTFPPTSERPEYHVIYDAGASAVRATVVGFNTLPGAKNGGKGKKEAEGTAIAVHGVGFDRTVGGVELDRRLRDILADDFARRHKRDVRADRRGMAKLWKEAGRVKAILSANADAVASVESLAFDVDYRAKVTRAQFEGACKDLQLKFAKPIFDALSNANLTLDDVASVILTGGATRTPMIQSAVKAAVGESKIAQNVNADEAAALGAGLYAASLNRAFKTKENRITDITPYDIQSAYESELKIQPEGSSAGTKPPRTIHMVLFPAGSALTKKKTLSMKRKEDTTLRLEYKAPPVPGYPTDLYEAEITGVSEALANLTEAGALNPTVKVNVHLSESGLVTVQDAVMYGEIKDESLTGKLKSLFGAGSATGTETAEGEGETAGDGENASTDAEAEAEAEAAAQIEAPQKKAPVKDTIPLGVAVKDAVSLAMSKAEKRNARDRLLAIDRAEADKRFKEEARNGLEGYLYRIRDLLEEEGETPFRKCSKEGERTEMKQKLEETFAWLHDHGDEANTHDYISRRSAIEKLEQPVMHRYTEVQEFPRALNQSQMWNWSARMFITEAKVALEKAAQGGEAARYTPEEVAELEQTLIAHEVWLNDAVERQKAATMYDDPAVESAELRARAKVLESHLQRLAKKKAPKRKTAAGASATSAATSTTSTTSGAQAEEATPAGHHDEL